MPKRLGQHLGKLPSMSNTWSLTAICIPSPLDGWHYKKPALAAHLVSNGVSLVALTDSHHLTECHTPNIEESPGHGKQWQGQHCHDPQIEALIVLLNSDSEGRGWCSHSCQSGTEHSSLLLLLQSCLSCLWWCHKRRTEAKAQDIGECSHHQHWSYCGTGASHDWRIMVWSTTTGSRGKMASI